MSFLKVMSALEVPLQSFYFCVYDPINDIYYKAEGRHFWKEFSPTDPGFDPNMLLSHFMKTRTDLPKENFVKALVIPVEDLPNTVFQYSPGYEEFSGLIMLQHVMNKGGVCLVYENHYNAFHQSVESANSAPDFIHETLSRHQVDASYLDIVYKMDSIPAFIQAKIEQMEGPRDWTDWEQDGLENRTKSDFSIGSMDYTEFVVLQPPSSGASTTVPPSPNFFSG
ncbi:hypothetical protein BT96DRAFT_994032 [Gymnopus androsaceus JB14]|uniref:Uncharacterized protein n=1 Tax=Gymnopus androsaceus JB14 TaxID=1447944 RepID=A0A6A4HMW4_9AGAR|nr:hypothetical protein BT96DRAFT_994032 [Gymnopus androsaceus JB14]